MRNIDEREENRGGKEKEEKKKILATMVLPIKHLMSTDCKATACCKKPRRYEGIIPCSSTLANVSIFEDFCAFLDDQEHFILFKILIFKVIGFLKLLLFDIFLAEDFSILPKRV